MALLLSNINRGINFAKYYGGGGGDKNGCWEKKMKTEGVGKKMKKTGKGGKETVGKQLKIASLRVKNSNGRREKKLCAEGEEGKI